LPWRRIGAAPEIAANSMCTHSVACYELQSCIRQCHVRNDREDMRRTCGGPKSSERRVSSEPRKKIRSVHAGTRRFSLLSYPSGSG